MTRRPRPACLAFWRVHLATLLVAISCASPRARIDPKAAAEDRLRNLAAAHQTETVFEVRYNPAACEVPPFEVLLAGAWHRVFLEPDAPDGPVAILRERLRTATDPDSDPRSAKVSGRLLSRIRTAANRSPYPVLTVVRLCESDECDALQGGETR